MLAAAVGNVKAHHDRKNLRLKKLLNIKNIKSVKNNAKFIKNFANISNSPPIPIYPRNDTAGGAIIIKSVGINFIANWS